MTTEENSVGSARALDAAFRFQYELRLGLALATGATVATLTVYLMLAADLTDYARSLLTLSAVRSMVLAAAGVSGLIQLAIAGGLVALLALFASHKIAGPTVRLVSLLRIIGAGKLPGPVHFRAGDQTGRLASHFNRVTERLASRHTDVVDQIAGLRNACAELQSVLAVPGTGEQRPALADEIRQRADALADRLRAIASVDSGDRTVP